MAGAILTDVEPPFFRITINRASVKNALNLEALDGLIDAFERARHDTRASAILLRGAGGDFSSGGDVNDMLARRGQAVATHARLRAGLTRISNLITGHEKPVLAIVDGVCLGAGAGVALSCDGLLATARSTFGFPFVKVGLVPDTSTSWLLPRFAGLQQARRLLLGGELIPAEEAHRIGLVMKLVPDAAALDREAADWGRRFAALPATAVRDIKRLLWSNLSAPLGHAVAHETLVQAVRFTSDEHARASEAFLRKTGPT